MDSPVFYIIVALMFASATLSVIFFIAWKTLGRKRHALSWSVGFLAATFHWFFNLQSSSFPSHETYWLTVNALALVSITLGIRGHCQRTECRILPTNLWPYASVIFAGVIWVTVVQPNAGVGAAIMPASACVTLFLSALMIIRHREKTRPAEWAAAGSMVLFGTTQGIAAGVASLQVAAGGPSFEILYVNYNYLTFPSGYIAIGMFVILMLASDISFEMKEIAIHDQLTGVLNRRGLGERAAAAFATSRRNEFPVSIIMTDIDRFKSFNDEFGHAAGDAALVHFSDLLVEDRRADDFVARVGGEEFALVLPGTGLKSALRIADELCLKIACSPMQLDGAALNMTASFGVATISDRDVGLADAIVRADRALYLSKRAGRNKVDLESSQMVLTLDGKLQPVSG
jgi:diguanylate cyclase (GGDEF)-like protein